MECRSHQIDANRILPAKRRAASRPLEFLNDVTLECAVVFGGATITIRRFLTLTPGTILELDKPEGDPVDLCVNGRPVAHGEVVVINQHFGLRITEIRANEDDIP